MKKGFTLIELLGVLVILGVLAVITVPLIQGLISDAGDDSTKVQEESFVKSAQTWAGNNAFSLPEAGENKILSLSDLIDGGYLEANKEENGDYYINKSNSNKQYDLKNDCVIITNEGTSTNAKYKYEFKENCNS